jgi:hypothetical protein
MIDPITALATVQSAVALIKKVSKTVDDVASLGPVIGKYFHAKHEATKAVNEAKIKGGSALGKAIEVELALKAQRDFEKELADLFFSTNNMDVWNAIKKRAADYEREAIDLKRKAEAIQKVRELEQQQLRQWILFIILSVCLVCLSTFLYVSFTNNV